MPLFVPEPKYTIYLPVHEIICPSSHELAND